MKIVFLAAILVEWTYCVGAQNQTIFVDGGTTAMAEMTSTTSVNVDFTSTVVSNVTDNYIVMTTNADELNNNPSLNTSPTTYKDIDSSTTTTDPITTVEPLSGGTVLYASRYVLILLPILFLM
ncbi:hypothetical protein Zmor_020388 [Zophobas morio]|uniref:Uncharacterized protein n=1 Tax=Zophobas morio TaxID=2755281 RepID=A0AA38I329_9CUCU|nr:hypothetical protein Zmor_020388 [Zophobas morio]